MRLDHIAYRVRDRYKTAKFFENTLGYTIGTEFQIEFGDGSTASCLTLVPPGERHPKTCMWTCKILMGTQETSSWEAEYHAAPEIFISDGPPGSIIGNWVADRGNVGGVHHMAYQVDDIKATMDEWKEAGYAEFLSDEPMTCPGLVQVFTKPSELTGVIYELISREGDGFCEDNVRDLMLSTIDQ